MLGYADQGSTPAVECGTSRGQSSTDGNPTEHVEVDLQGLGSLVDVPSQVEKLAEVGCSYPETQT